MPQLLLLGEVEESYKFEQICHLCLRFYNFFQKRQVVLATSIL